MAFLSAAATEPEPEGVMSQASRLLPTINVTGSSSLSYADSDPGGFSLTVPPPPAHPSTSTHDHASFSALPEESGAVPENIICGSRPRGRPRTKPRVFGPKQKRGRPPKALQAPTDVDNRTNEGRLVKKARGRPRKSAPQSVTIQLGKFVVPGTQNKRTTATSNSGVLTSLQQPPTVHTPAAVSKTGSSQDTTMIEPQSIPPICLTVIQDEDPDREIEDVNEDEDSGVNGAGIGVSDEVYGVFDDDKDDDVGDVGGFGESAEETSGDPGRQNAPRLERRPLPSWLMEPFLAAVQESKQRDDSGLPPLYQKSTFWFPKRSPYFILRSQPHVSPHNLYSPKFFLWDPHALYKIPCPGCHKTLHQHQHISHPRRCIDVNSTFWIIGYRYRCRNCSNPRTGLQSVTYRSWDPRIMALLPSELAAEFPACLSHRSGISKTLFELMRGSFQNGLGSRQFADLLRVQHLLAYDNLQLQYLNHLVTRQNSLDTWVDKTRLYEPFLPFDDTSPHGRHGYTPSSVWLRDIYDSYIETHQQYFNQHMSMLTGEICAIDHSHKVTKHVARVEGEQVFTALLTVTNEKGEIRICNFVATKSHSQFEDALARMRTSLNLYGHQQPLLFYTDNMADKLFLENSFPSLRKGVMSLQKYAHLDSFELPDGTDIFIVDTSHSINNAISTILNNVPENDGEIAVGFDMEWNVELTPQGLVWSSQKAAILQIAYEKCVYILQISSMVARGELPHQLELFLSHPRIRKVGRLISGDLMRLQKTCCKPTTPSFTGGLDLAKMAKERYIITSANVGLADLAAIVLQKRLDKNTPLRTSESWENTTLNHEQVSYASKDAYASLLIYHELVNHYPVPFPLPAVFPPTMPTILYSSNLRNVIAEGVTSQLDSYNGATISSNHAIIDVQRVLVPGAIISYHKRSLESFGKPPFAIVAPRNLLRIYSPRQSQYQPNVVESAPAQLELSTNHVGMDSVEGLDKPVDEMISVGDSLKDDLSGPTQELPLSNEAFESTNEKLSADELLGVVKDPNTWDNNIHSRVLKDPWHMFHMIYLPATHGIRKQFTREFRDAIFIPDQQDRDRIDAWGATQIPPTTYEKLRNSSPEWIRKRCRHTIPPPHILYPLVRKVFNTYGPITDPVTKQALFSSKSQWKMARNILELIRQGFMSDPPGISLYTQFGIDKQTSLPMYRCIRGTNAIEGGVHTHIKSRLPKFGVSIRHVQASLLDFTLRHNLLVGTYNSTGQHYQGHFSIWTTNRIQELVTTLGDTFSRPVQLNGWVNGNMYVQTKEVIGILPIPDDIRNANGIMPYDPTSQKQKYSFMARMQNTQKAVLPVHTAIEQDLFRTLMATEHVFSPQSGDPHWNDAVIIWNKHADKLEGVYYKLVEHLKAYHSKWKTLLHAKETLSLTTNIRRPLMQLIHDPTRSLIVPPVPTNFPQPLHVDSGHIDITNPENESTYNSSTITTKLFFPDTACLQPRAITPTSVSHTHVHQKKSLVGPQRRQRTCRKCALPDCKGKRAVTDCRNKCQDCGKIECKGRNSRKLHLKCKEGWE